MVTSLTFYWSDLKKYQMGVGKTKLSACHSLLLFQERGTEEWTLLNKMQAKGVYQHN